MIRQRKPLVRKTPMKKVSARRQRESKVYAAKRKAFMEQIRVCEVCPPGSYSHATDIHHKAKRGKNYLNPDTWMLVCRKCHDWIHAHPKEARAKGWLL